MRASGEHLDFLGFRDRRGGRRRRSDRLSFFRGVGRLVRGLVRRRLRRRLGLVAHIKSLGKRQKTLTY